MKYLLIVTAVFAIAANANAQNVASRVRPSFEDTTPTTDDIIIPGRVVGHPYPMPYERHVRSASSFTSEAREGRTRYEFRRRLWGSEDGLHVDMTRTWSVDEVGRDSGAPDRDGQRFRLACSFPLDSCLRGKN